ncbi:MAG: methyltransferase domain-containing protein [Anaerolineae bacterium]|nr:methyltransferase domain-containing protein [Anaerolineae bacterium]
MTPEEWHAWFTVQAEWTRPAREWLYGQAGWSGASALLDVGCGTGVIARDVLQRWRGRVVGLDVDPEMLGVARRSAGQVAWVQGDAHRLPFPDGSFDGVVCHYLLLWLSDPAQGVREMARVVRSGGAVLVCAEPDYGGRIDHPPELARLGRLQAEALAGQGADPECGRRLGAYFAAAGLRATVGVMAGGWSVPSAAGPAFEAEWAMRARDAAGRLSVEELAHLRRIDARALEAGERVLFVPTFYAVGYKT